MISNPGFETGPGWTGVALPPLDDLPRQDVPPSDQELMAALGARPSLVIAAGWPLVIAAELVAILLVLIVIAVRV